ncbi:hypothetical protein S245_023739, partial [Arachis hypogaea]
HTNELVAIKYIERGDKIDENVRREIINHRSLRHPNIVRFKKVILTPTHLSIVMEYAAGGELFERASSSNNLSQGLAIVMQWYQHVCHRELKLENTLLDGMLHSQPKSKVGTPAYIAPEVLLRKEYDGKIADVWSCGLTLYVMLVGSYPFQDPDEPKISRRQLIINISPECRHLVSRIFVADPTQ